MLIDPPHVTAMLCDGKADAPGRLAHDGGRGALITAMPRPLRDGLTRLLKFVGVQ
jgi:hypothetical protein